MTQPVPAAPASSWRASLSLRFAKRDSESYLAHVQHQGPLRLQKPLYPEGRETCHCILLHPPGGIAAGDTLEISVHAEKQSKAMMTTPGASKWYRSAQGRQEGGSQNVRIHVERDAFVEWLPQENILFNGANAHIFTQIDLEEGAGFIGVDTCCFGRRASGERFEQGSLRMGIDVRFCGQPLWHERTNLEAASPVMHSEIGLAGFSMCSTIIAAGLTVGADTLAACRQIEPKETGARCGFTVMPNLFIGRYLGDSSEAARHWFLRVFGVLRPALSARLALTPRIWLT